jgi:Protein of unknown function (DUF3995)
MTLPRAALDVSIPSGMVWLMTYPVAAGLCAAVFLVHTFAGQRRVVSPLLESDTRQFAKSTLLVVWHMVTWTLAVSFVALLLAPRTPALALVVTVLTLGYAGAFLAVASLRMGAAIRLPQWILLGATGLASLAAYADRGPWFFKGSLLAIAVLHLAWTAGASWPEASREALALAVIGRPAFPSRAACLIVAAALVAFALGPVPPVVVGAIFAARGLLGFVEPWLRREIHGTAYEAYSRFIYSPLALAIGVVGLTQ